MVDQRRIDHEHALVEHTAGDVERRIDHQHALIEHTAGDVERRVDHMHALIEYTILTTRYYGPAVQVIGG